jgi:phospholipid/cholesterol/gamma-HCH transport system permease protein
MATPFPSDTSPPRSATIRAPATLSDAEGARLLDEVGSIIAGGADDIAIDLGDLKDIDSRGGAWLIRAARAAQSSGARISITNPRGEVAEFIELIGDNFAELPAPEERRAGLFEAMGQKALAVWHETMDAGRLFVDTVYWSFIAPVEGRGVRWKGLIDELDETGAKAIGIVSLLNLLLGLVIAMLSAAQAGTFGVQIYVANLVVIGFAKELAVVMTGIVVSARTGSAIAAELATMKVYDEIDALKGMGLSVAKFLIAPKVLAILIAMPILTAIGFVMGVAGGFVLGVFSMGFTFERWWEQTVQAATLRDFAQGGLKSVCFALIIVLVGCHNGLRVSGSARGVGIATTRAVVMDVFLIVVADLIFALVFYFFL